VAEVMMKKLTLAGIVGERANVLSELAFCGAVEVTEAAYLLEEGELPGTSVDVGDSHALRADVEKLKNAIDVLTPLAPKPGLLTAKASIGRKGMQAALTRREDVLASADEVLSVSRTKAALVPERNRIEGQIASLKPWETSDLSLSNTGTALVGILYGTLPAALEAEAIDEKTDGLDAYLLSVSVDKTARYVIVFFHRGAEDEVQTALREIGFSRLQFREFVDTPAQTIQGLEKQIADSLAQTEDLNKQLLDLAPGIAAMKEMYDSLGSLLTIEEARSRLLVSKSAFFMKGFVPVNRIEVLEQRLAAYCVTYEFEEVDNEVDSPPVLLNNSSLVQPYEAVTELYSLPSPGAFDPNPVIAPFFFLFYGIMLGDAGYGIMMIIIGLLAKKTNPQGFAKKLFNLCLHAGTAALIVGFVTGTYFGDAYYTITGTFLGRARDAYMLFDPMADPLIFLAICCAMGIVHMLVGMGINFGMCIKRGDYFTAIVDIGFWWTVFIGIAMLVLGVPIAYGVIGAGTIGLILTQGRSKEGLISKLWSGILSLYGITGYLGDMLSYARLMALALAGSVIAQVFNQLGTLFGGTFFGAIYFIVIFLVGHTINFLLGILGAFVHTSRLQYVEFFGKFFEAGGRPFDPLLIKPKYYTLSINEEEHSYV